MSFCFLYLVPLPAFGAVLFILFWKGAVSPLLQVLGHGSLLFNLQTARRQCEGPRSPFELFQVLPDTQPVQIVPGILRALMPSGRFFTPTR